ncbi:MAG TPA: hypothetical protein VGY97_09605 [Solirubrobacteraceae bacterium]|nr:hypothetical protein [Solirubrobacteraceae bacterium]
MFDQKVIVAAGVRHLLTRTDYSLRDSLGQTIGTAKGTAGGRIEGGIEVRDASGELVLRVVRSKRFWRHDASVLDRAGGEYGQLTAVKRLFKRRWWTLTVAGRSVGSLRSVGYRSFRFEIFDDKGASVARLIQLKPREISARLPEPEKGNFGGGWMLTVSAPVEDSLRPLMVAVLPAMSAYAYDNRPRVRM